VSDHGDVVDFDLSPGGRRARLDLLAGRLEFNAMPDATLVAPIAEALSQKFQEWQGSHALRFNGHTLSLADGEVSLCFAIAPTGERLVLGTNFWLRAYDEDGKLIWQTDAGESVWTVNITPDGKTVVAGVGDGTLRWYDLADGRALLSALAQPDGSWVAWLPEGFYTASQTGAELVGYQLNRGFDQSPDFVRFEQLFHQFYRPDLVLDRLARNETPIKTALSQIGSVDALLATARPPMITVSGPARITISHHTYEISGTILDRGGGLGAIHFRVNGVNILGTARTDSPKLGDGRIVYDEPLDLGPGTNDIQVTATSRDGNLVSIPAEISVTVKETGASPSRLFGIAVGIDEYSDKAMHLNFAAADAGEIKSVLSDEAKGIFFNANIVYLPDGAATKENIIAAFKQIAPQVRPTDVFVLFLAGHGTFQDGRYFFVPQDAPFDDDARLTTASLSEDDLIDLLGEIRTQKSLVLIDTCYAGRFLASHQTSMLNRDLRESGAFDRLNRVSGRLVLAATSDTDTALEGYRGHGLFTYVLLEGLRGAAAYKGDIDVMLLSSYVVTHVRDLSKTVFHRDQSPMAAIAFSGDSFAIAHVP
jgi:hypothetical protein